MWAVVNSMSAPGSKSDTPLGVLTSLPRKLEPRMLVMRTDSVLKTAAPSARFQGANLQPKFDIIDALLAAKLFDVLECDRV